MRLYSTIAHVLLLGFTSLILTGCNSFRVSEADVNKDLAKQLEQSKETRLALTSGDAVVLNLAIKAAKVDFLERDGGLISVALMCDLTGEVSAFGQSFSLTTDVNPSFESGIRLQDKQLFLVAPRFTQVVISGSRFDENIIRSTLGSLQDKVEVALRDYFDHHPVYELNHSPFEKLAASMVSDIVIEDDSLELSMF
ncbi:DUF1439 domain-containing protein [Marinomonas posidonica]|uniref:Lipoprotein n=1 Tax=Marinomonas posidonica (strain CECT 7376 / NCIMB 14433 / IVIA-Po-181) TaxID=491952 RepID=F6D0U4_MARPP|nr:DUF1439 domain-containing protein [Marinomonas posidonica]AEF55976.1 hypothetical protein Mar181_2947 [Marinomonas posidonica IVIA-Po-181]